MKMIRASDARSWLHCQRRVWFDNNPPAGFELFLINEFDQILIDRGNFLEWNIKRKLENQYQLVEAVSEEHTKELMGAGVQIIYQGRISKNGVVGRPDFLIRHESGEYQAADAKLSRNEEKAEIQIQFGVYRILLNSSLPSLVYLGNGEVTEIGDEANREASKYLTSMKNILAGSIRPLVRYSESKCNACGYNELCKPRFEEQRELTLLYGIDSRMAPGLEIHGIDTIEKLANVNPDNIPDIPYLKGREKKQRAVYQAKSYLDGNIYPLKSIDIPDGTWIHFDVETNPITDSGEEHVYLWGFLKPGNIFDYVWTDSEADDRKGWDLFLAKIEEYKNLYPNLIIAHFSNYERQKIKAYAERYEMVVHPTVSWLLGDDSPLFDLFKLVTDSLVLPLASYGLKSICKHPKLVNFQWADEDSGSQWSIVQFLKYLAAVRPDDKERLKLNILTYNFDDVMASRKLEEWLRAMTIAA